MPLSNAHKRLSEMLMEREIQLEEQHNLLTAFAAMGDQGLEDWCSEYCDYTLWHPSMSWIADYDLDQDVPSLLQQMVWEDGWCGTITVWSVQLPEPMTGRVMQSIYLPETKNVLDIVPVVVDWAKQAVKDAERREAKRPR